MKKKPIHITNVQKGSAGRTSNPVVTPISIEIEISRITASCLDSDLAQTVLRDNASRDLALRLGAIIMILSRFFGHGPKERAALLLEVGECLDAVRADLLNPNKAFDPAHLSAVAIIKTETVKAKETK